MRILLPIVNGELQIGVALRFARKYHIGITLATFVVDTGSNKSLISYKDAVRINLPFTTLKTTEHTRIGGSIFALRDISDIALSFETDTKDLYTFYMKKFCVATGTKTGREEKNISMGVPSILGLDFLIENKLALYANPSKNIAYLELVE